MAGYKDIEPRWKPGESGNPKGKLKGTKNKRTIAREMLSLTAILPDKKFAEMSKVYPEITKEMTAAELMFVTQISKAIAQSDTAAFKAAMDYAPDQIEDEDEAEKASKYFKIRDSIIDKHYRFLEEGYDWSIEEGGSRSGKTYNALKWCVSQTLKGRFDLNLIAPSYKMLASGMFLDVKAIIEEFQLDVKVPKQTTKIEMPNLS